MLTQVQLEIHSTNQVRPAVYRIYADGDLVTERTWVWDTATTIDESFALELGAGEHTVTLTTTDSPPTNFYIANPRINSETRGNINGLTLTFTV